MSDPICPFCDVRLAPADQTDGWCDNCGKKLPAHPTAEAIQRTAPSAKSADTIQDTASPSREPIQEPLGGERGSTQVTLEGRAELVMEPLPSVCMCCGATATTIKKKKFAWFPRWVYLLIGFGLLPFAVVALVLTKKMTVRMPLCNRHRFPWLWQQLLTVFAAFYMILPCILGALVERLERSLGGDNTVVPGLMLGWLFGLLGLVICLVGAAMLHIRVKRITDYEITLAGVSTAFAARLGR
jgi:hypothetical protein